MRKKYFLWPMNSRFFSCKSFFNLKTTQQVERRLQDMFPSGYPVLFSSGRSALSAALMQSNVSRKDFVGVYPYASHCVLDAISRVATPLSGQSGANTSVKIVYHQWGYPQEVDLPTNAIEDSADTLCKAGARLFPGGGAFEIWSLSKILGTTSGGVLWCRTEQSAFIAKKIRDERGGGFSIWVIRLFGRFLMGAHLCWQGIEPSRGGISKIQAGEIYGAMKNWNKIVALREKKIRMLLPYALDWLPIAKDRLPCVVPVKCLYPEDEIIDLGISSGYRMIKRVSKDFEISEEKVLPIPIHQDVDELWIKEILRGCLDKDK